MEWIVEFCFDAFFFSDKLSVAVCGRGRKPPILPWWRSVGTIRNSDRELVSASAVAMVPSS